MVTRSHTTVPARIIDDALRLMGRCVVRLPNTAIKFEISHRGVEVVFDGCRFVMMRERDQNRDFIGYYVKIHQRWDCRATQEGFDGLSHFEVIDKAGCSFEHDDIIDASLYAKALNPYLESLNDKKRKKVLLCV